MLSEKLNDEGVSVENELGELMLTQPMPNMPVYFWNDNKNEKYKNAYFGQNEYSLETRRLD